MTTEPAWIVIDGERVEVTEQVAAEVARLRDRIQQVASEGQTRAAAAESALADHRNTADYARKVFAERGGDFGFSNAIGRAYVLELLEEKATLQGRLDAVETELIRGGQTAAIRCHAALNALAGSTPKDGTPS